MLNQAFAILSQRGQRIGSDGLALAPLDRRRPCADQANREVNTRFDFKGTGSKYGLDQQSILLTSQSEFQLDQMMDILRQKLSKRGIDIACIDEQDVEISGSEATKDNHVRICNSIGSSRLSSPPKVSARLKRPR